MTVEAARDDYDLARTVRAALPALVDEEAADVAQAVVRLAEAFHPVTIHLFGSQARGSATPQSDVDLLVIVPESREPGYKRDQRAYAAVGDHLFPLDIVVLTQEEYEQRLSSPASLPATVAREGRVVYAA